MKIIEKFGYIMLQQYLPLVTVIILGIFTYAYFFVIPYTDFQLTSDGQIYWVSNESQFQIDDVILQFNSTDTVDFERNPKKLLLYKIIIGEINIGETSSVLIERNGEIITIPWTFSQASWSTRVLRLSGTWWIPYVFWFVGTVTFLFIRPKNTQWWLLIAFNYLSAIWIATGEELAGWGIWHADVIFTITLWMSIPIYLHLHWIFPKPLRKFPIWLVYVASSILMVLDSLKLLPASFFIFGFFFSIAGSLILVVFHAIYQPDQRLAIRQLTKLVALILFPLIFTTIYSLLGGDSRYIALALIGFPFLPLAYIYAIYRNQLGDLEVRANRLIVIYFYLTLLITAASFTVSLLTNSLTFPGANIFITLLTIIVATLITILWFTPFERFVERRILGMPIPPAALLQTYATAVSTKLDKPSLAKMLANEITPSLLVRQSALVYYDFYQQSMPTEGQYLSTLFNHAGDPLPVSKDVPTLLNQANMYRLNVEQGGNPMPCPWVRLVLPLQLGERVLGLWLLGKRDPDDFYSQGEITVLKALASQTAVALANILQAQNLHALYQQNIDKQEQERNQLALDLHDDVLNQLGLLGMYADENGVAPQFFDVYENLTARFRETIHGLRPVMLNYGLSFAFEAMVGEMSKRPSDQTIVKSELPSCQVRYPVQVEQHLYRIVEQAIENALKHAQADNIRIHGRLLPSELNLFVEDDGIGMPGNEPLDLSVLLQRKHFGLAGMFERAELIGARMKLSSTSGKGTKISLSWIPKPDQMDAVQQTSELQLDL